jgi:hypothetical protein
LSVCGEGVLQKIVRSHGEKIAVPRERFAHQSRRGRFYHYPERDILVKIHAFIAKLVFDLD